MMNTKRILSPYERTHLARFGKSNIDISEYGEMPVEYITGKVEFCGHVFNINQDTLIPRVESEELVNLAISQIKDLTFDICHLPFAIADIGTGCGAIGLSIHSELEKQKIPHEIYLSDISEEALKICKLNLQTNTSNEIRLPDEALAKAGNTRLDTRNSKLVTRNLSVVNIVKSDLLEAYPKDIKFDLIVANLPYIPEDRLDYLDKSVVDYEPEIALNGGPEGLSLIAKLLKQAKNRLKPGGKILLEIDYTHKKPDLQALAPDLDVEIKIDSFERSRFAVIQLEINN